MELDCFTALCVDPGLKNCGTAIVDVFHDQSRVHRVCLGYHHVFDLSGTSNPDLGKAAHMTEVLVDVMKERGTGDCLVEFQPAINAPHTCGLIRNNSWVEAFVCGSLIQAGKTVTMVYPNHLKWFMDISAKTHYANKRLVLEKAREYVKEDISDHEADCVIMAVYHVLYNKLGLKQI